mgnify:CR=1 FL=1
MELNIGFRIHLDIKLDTKCILLQEIKLSIEECTADEFVMFMAMLGATSLPKTMRYFLI